MATVSPPRTSIAGQPQLLDRIQPDFDVTRIEHRVIAAPSDEVYRAVREADMMLAVSRNLVVRVSFALRAAGERVVALLRGRPRPERPELEHLRFGDMTAHGDWVVLGEDPAREFVFGVIGRFWGGETVWEQIDADDFATFSRPGYGKIACHFLLRPLSPQRTSVSYEARTRMTDSASRKAFLRYWRPLSPFIGAVMGSALRVIDEEACAR